MFIVKTFYDILSTLTSFLQILSPFFPPLYITQPHFFSFLPLYLHKCGGARGGRCLITHEHHQLKWSSENDVNR